MAPVSPGDVGVELGRTLSATETLQVQQWIDDAYAVITTRYPGGFDPAAAGRAVRAVVARYLSMPRDGATLHEVGVDDARTIRRYGSGSSITLDSLLAEWWPVLDPAQAGGSAFSISPGYR